MDFGDATPCCEDSGEMWRGGLLVANEGQSLLLLPALNVSQAAAAQGLDILERCV